MNKKNIVQMLILIVLTILMISIYFPVRISLNSRLEDFKESYIVQFEEKYNVFIKYKSMSPTIINSIKVRDFSVAGSAQRDFSLFFERISLFYGLRLFTEQNRFTLRRIVLKNGEITLNLPDNQNSSNINGKELLGEVTRLLRSYFPVGSIDIRNVKIRIMIKGIPVIWEVDKLLLTAGDDIVKFNHKGFISLNEDYHSFIQLRGSSSLDFLSINALIDLQSLISPYVNLNGLSLNLIRTPEEGLLLRKVKDKTPLDFSIGYNKELINLIYQSESFIPESIFTTGVLLDEYKPWLNSEISGSFSTTLSPDLERILYDTDLIIKADNEFIAPFIGGVGMAEIAMTGDKNNTEINHLSLKSPQVDISYKGSLGYFQKELNGVFEIQNWLLPSGSLLSTTLDVNSNKETVELTTNNSRINNQTVGDLKGMGEIKWEEKKALANLIYNGKFAENIGVDVYAEFQDDFSFLSWFDIESLNIIDLLRTYDPDLSFDSINKIVGESLLTTKGSLEYKKGLNLNIESCLFQGPLYNFSFNGYGKDKQFFLSDITFVSGENNLDGSLKINLIDDLSALLRFSLNDHYYDINMSWLKEKKEILFNGSYGLEGSFSYIDDRVSYFSLKSEELPIKWKDYNTRMSLALSGSLKDGNLLVNMNENVLFLDSTPFLPSGKVILSGLLDEGLLQLYRLEWIDDISHLSGTGMVNLPMKSSGLLNGWVTLLSPDDEKYKIVFSQRDQNLSCYLSLNNFILDRLPLENYQGRLNTVIEGKDLLRNPAVSGEFDIMLDPKGALKGLMIYENKRLTLSSLAGNWGKANLKSGLLSLDMKKGSINLSAGMTGIMARKPWETGIVASFDVEDVNNPLVSNIQGIIKLDEIIHGETILSPRLTFNFSKKEKDYYLYNSDRDVLNLLYNGDSGSITALSQKLLPLAFHLQGYLSKDNLDLRLTDLEMDLTSFNLLMPADRISSNKIVEFISGDLSGDLYITGNPDEPVLNGYFDINPLQLDTAYSVKEKGISQMQILIKDNMINIPYFEFAIGTTGTIGATAELILKGLDLEEYDFDFFLKGRNGGSLPMIYLIKGLALNGEVRGDASFHGGGGQNFIDGNIIIDRMILSLVQNVAKIPRKRSLDPMDLQVDVKFTTGRDVAMVIPNEDFYFVKASLDIDQELILKLDNIPKTFSLTGDFSIRQGDIAYFDKNFYLTQGRVLFNEDQDEFNPLLDLNAETLVAYKGEEVTLMIAYKGSLFSDFDPLFSSLPSYTEREILAMMEPYQSDDSASLALALGAYVDKYTFSAPFEEGIKKVLDVDLVTIETGLLKNILEDQLNNGQGVYTNSSSQYNIARYLDGTFLNVGKYISKDLFVSGGINLDYNTNQTFMGGMGFNFNLTFEMETPFFNIGWTYLPDEFTNLNSSEGFISDTGITINFRL